MEYKIRELEESDINESLFNTLSNLRNCGELTKEKAAFILWKMQCNPYHKCYVAVNDSNKVIGCSTLVCEQKFINNGGIAGHIEDVVVNKDYVGKGIGSALINKMIEIAKQKGCYKAILECTEETTSYYEKLGFRKHEVGMRINL